MAYSRFNLTRITPSQLRGVQEEFAYISNTDTIAEITAAGYFDAADFGCDADCKVKIGAFGTDGNSSFIYGIFSGTVECCGIGGFSGDETLSMLQSSTENNSPTLPVTVVDSDATDTLIQYNGTAWDVSSSTNPSTGQTILSPDRTTYTQYGNVRYYTVLLQTDSDDAIEFGVIGALDLAMVVPVGYSSSAGDVANRMVNAYRSGVNTAYVKRLSDNNADMSIALTFIAIM